MQCTCRDSARCPVCNATVQVPFARMPGSAGGATYADRIARRASAASRESLRRLAQGSTTCPSCGSAVRHDHSRSCFAQALASAGVPPHERETILAKITFPEG
jgi:hypothetical protein